MIIGPRSATNGNSIATKHKEARSPFLKADLRSVPLMPICKFTKIHSALWHVLRSWSRVILAKFGSPMPQEIVRTLTTTPWRHSVRELFPLRHSFHLFAHRSRPPRWSNLENLMDHCQPRNEKINGSSATRVCGTPGTPSIDTPLKCRFSNLQTNSVPSPSSLC